jgi:hypothetical protein
LYLRSREKGYVVHLNDHRHAVRENASIRPCCQDFGAVISGRSKKKAKPAGKAAPLANAGARIDKFLARPAPAARPSTALQARSGRSLWQKHQVTAGSGM